MYIHAPSGFGNSPELPSSSSPRFGRGISEMPSLGGRGKGVSSADSPPKIPLLCLMIDPFFGAEQTMGMMMGQGAMASSSTASSSTASSFHDFPMDDDQHPHRLPSIQDCANAIHQCKQGKDLAQARSLHAQLCAHGFQTEAGGLLVPLLARCGAACDAERVFLQLDRRSEHSWNRLIQGFVDCGRLDHALAAYRSSKVERISPSKHTLVAILKACARMRKGDEGRNVRIDLASKGLERDPFVGSTLVSMYAKCGLIEEAAEVFFDLPIRDVVAWNALISGYTDNGRGNEALHFLEEMVSEGVSPNIVTYICTLKICGSLGYVDRVKSLHSEVVKKGLESDIPANNTLVDTYAKCGLLDDARKTFDHLELQDVISWTSLITGCADNGHNEKALSYMSEMQSKGFPPDGVTLTCSLKACGNMVSAEKGKEVHSEIVKKGFDEDPFIGNALVDVYIKCRSAKDAHKVFEKLTNRDVVSWNTLLTGLSEEELDDKVLKCLDQMQGEGISPDDVTFINYLKICGNMGAAYRGQDTYSEVVKKGLEKNHFICSVLVDMYAKCGYLSEAKQIFDKLDNQDVVLWNSLIAAYAGQGYHDEVLVCINQMRSMKISLDPITYVLSLKSCGAVASEADCRNLHSEIVKRGFEIDSFIGNILVDVYAKCDLHKEAKNVFDGLPVHNVISWNSIISSFAEGEDVMQMFVCLEQMQLERLSPDSISFVLMLKGCGNMGTLTKGREVHARIILQGFERDALITSTLIDMYAECMALDEAKFVFNSFPGHDVVSWTGLLTAYAEVGFDEEILVLLEDMKLKSLCPDVVMLMYFMRACRNSGAVVKGQELHSSIVARGLEDEMLIQNNLVDMYVKFDLLADALDIFNKSSIQKSLSWSAFIVAFSDEGLNVNVLNSLEQTELEGVPFDLATILFILKAYRRLGSIDKGREVHNQLVKLGLDLIPVTSNTLIDMYVQYGELEEAQIMFNTAPIRDVISWNLIITAYAEYGLDELALYHLEEMQTECIAPNAVTFACILKHCANIDMGKNIHIETVKKGFDNDPVVSSILMDMYATHGLLLEPREIFNQIPFQDIITWTTLIAGYGEHGNFEEILVCLDEMRIEGFSPNPITFVCILKACGSVRKLDIGREFHAEITKMGFDLEIMLGNPLLDMYAKCGSFMEANHIINEMQLQDVISWTALISGYTEHGHAMQALNCFYIMQQNHVSPNAVTFSCIMKACSMEKELLCGQEVHADIVKQGYEGELVVSNSLLLMYSKCCQCNEAVETFNNMFVRDAISWNTLMACYADAGLCDEVLLCFEEMQIEGVSIDVATWNVLFAAHADHGECGLALLNYMKMQQQGLLPDSTIFVTILRACGNAAKLEGGKRIHAQTSVATELMESREYLEAATIDMYGKCGCMKYAHDIFNAMPLRGLVTWNTLLTCYARYGETNTVFHSLETMNQEGLLSDDITFLCVINACSHAGLVSRGQHYFKRLSGEFGINPSVKHYSCMIDLLGRAGRLDEASELFKVMPFARDRLAINSMLGACQKWEDVEVGSETFERVQNVEMDHASFILMSNIFASGRLEV